MPGSIKADLKMIGFKGFAEAMTSAKFHANLKKRVSAATTKNALLMVKKVREVMKVSVPPKNAALTSAIKKSKKTLVDKGDLFQAITYEQTSWEQAFIGVLKTNANYNIAKGLHDGMVIPVTAKMRTMFFYLWLASLEAKGEYEGEPIKLTGRAAELFARYKDWRPLKATTKAIRIPGRPWFKIAMNDKDTQRIVQANWKTAVRQALDDQKKGAKKK